MIAMLREELLRIFNILEQKDRKLTPYKVALEAKINYANLTSALKGDRTFSDEMLKRLSETEYFQEVGVSYSDLLSWKAYDTFPREALEKAIKYYEGRGEC